MENIVATFNWNDTSIWVAHELHAAVAIKGFIYFQLKTFIIKVYNCFVDEMRPTNMCLFFYIFFLFTVLSLVSISRAEDFLIDKREGEDISLKCRFNEQPQTNDFSFYWARISGTKYENVAIGNVPLASNYR